MATYDARFLEVFSGMAGTAMSREWKEVLASKSPQEWLKDIKSYTPRVTIDLLGRIYPPPKFAELKALPWDATSENGGVYGDAIEGTLTTPGNFIYVGSASSIERRGERGLLARTRVHEKAGPDNRHHTLRVGRNCSWVTLLEIPNWDQDPPAEVILEYRYIVKLAEAIYSAWLNAYAADARNVSTALLELCPYDPTTLSWSGACTQSSLRESVPKPTNLETRLKKRENTKIKARKQHTEWLRRMTDDAKARRKESQKIYTRNWRARVKAREAGVQPLPEATLKKKSRLTEEKANVKVAAVKMEDRTTGKDVESHSTCEDFDPEDSDSLPLAQLAKRRKTQY